MARKFQLQASSPMNAAIAAINLRMATIHLAGLRIPPRVRNVPTVHRRLPITMFPQEVQPVIIRHASKI